ncbi:TIGR01906 family membrane protein [Fusibacter ferrireducens]|uniref:TIGR01906 family membrane protein n=1 Tax=Fusibacter ferrireducens TaxID=2785058 RepID=A0ABR9ZYT8_9FIRM|nr:TIGR01906 family membrane protein [Fusibacter ferrireducens]MBF4695328.1 TIGR01906 family membrane protein [Fusibacter ferrireducens]
MRHQANVLDTILIITVGILISILTYLYVFEAYAFSDSFYIKHFKALKVDEVVGISTADLEKVTSELIDYINTGAGDLHVTATIDGKTVEYFNAKEQAHLNDIKNLIRDARKIRNNMLIITFVLGLLALFRMYKTINRLSKIFLSTVIASFITLILLGILYVSDFDMAFRKFHELLFYNDLWLLNPAKDRLLQMMPLEFFMTFTVYCLGTLFIINAVFLSIYLGIQWQYRRKSRMFF